VDGVGFIYDLSISNGSNYYYWGTNEFDEVLGGSDWEIRVEDLTPIDFDPDAKYSVTISCSDWDWNTTEKTVWIQRSGKECDPSTSCGSVGGVGDINANSLCYEVGDAVYLSNYFIYGSHFEWIPGIEACQIFSTDVNRDGLVLTVADLVYLIRVITGDEQAFPPGLSGPKTAANVDSAVVALRRNDGLASLSCTSAYPLGGGYFVFSYKGGNVGEPVLTEVARGMRLRYRVDGGFLRILVHPPMGRGNDLTAIDSGDMFTVPTPGGVTVELLEVQLSDRYGAPIPAIWAASGVETVPNHYFLDQNYPNPFNAGTVIGFALPEASHVKVTVFNVLGQTVRVLSDQEMVAGLRQVSWDGCDGNGNTAASGLYFYRVTTAYGDASRKMVLLR
jgi:hypothetical protein